MSRIRWLAISEALARLGHQVDIATAGASRFPGHSRISRETTANPRLVSLGAVRWRDYDAIKVLFHEGFETLEAHRGADHPFVICKLGSVVGPEDREGIFFFGAERERLFATQQGIAKAARFVTLLSEPAEGLWHECFGAGTPTLRVPCGVARDLPRAGPDPYPDDGRIRCLFAGNVYNRVVQREANAELIRRLSAVGRALDERGARLYAIGAGDFGRLDKAAVRHLGAIPYRRSWDYLRFADVGVVVSAGRRMHNNESSKLYHYVRVGLPIVSERGFPNDHIVDESGTGFTVEPGDAEAMADAILEAHAQRWDRAGAVRYALANHTWERRCEVYDHLLRQEFPAS
jgi:glycosyltransferase involved in cell wall biosynthesis